MGKVIDIIKIFDIYGNFLNMRINKQNKFKSFAGGILSLLTIFIMVFCFISFGKDFYKRENPLVLREDGFFNTNTTPSLIGNDYPNKTFIFSYFKSLDSNLKLKLQINQNGSLIYRYLNYCNEDYLKNNSIVFNTLELTQKAFYCLNSNDFLIRPENSQALAISLETCDNIAPDLIKTYKYENCVKNSNFTITQLSFNIFSEKTGFSPDKENPFIKRFSKTGFILSSSVYTSILLSFSMNSLFDDRGWIVNSIQNFTDINLSITSNFQNLPASPKFPAVTIAFQVSADYVNFYRTYSKLQDLLASVGGFMKLVMTILNIFNLIIRSYLIDWYIIDKQFEYGNGFTKKISTTMIDFENKHNPSLNHGSSVNKSNILLIL
jgi:hypothetical protein